MTILLLVTCMLMWLISTIAVDYVFFVFSNSQVKVWQMTAILGRLILHERTAEAQNKYSRLSEYGAKFPYGGNAYSGFNSSIPVSKHDGEYSSITTLDEADGVLAFINRTTSIYTLRLANIKV
jgi:hypothetical protein